MKLCSDQSVTVVSRYKCLIFLMMCCITILTSCIHKRACSLKGTSFPSIICSCSQDIVINMLAKLFKIVDKSHRGILLTAVVELQEQQNIRYSVRAMITFISSQRLVGQRCNGSRNAVAKREPWLAAAFPACSAMTNEWLRTISKTIRIKHQPFQASAKL